MMTLAPIFLVIACVYSISGLAGGSSYLAVLAWFGLERGTLVPLALICNIVVAAQGTYAYLKGGFFQSHLFWPLALSSIPFAFVGGLTSISDKTFHFLLGLSLLIASIRMFFPTPPLVLSRLGGIVPKEQRTSGGAKALLKKKATSQKWFWILGPLVGAFLGYLAGLIGLGGGIFLGPLLILSGVVNAKQTAATTAPFIFVNSLAGLVAHSNYLTSSLLLQSTPLILAVGLGGWSGARLGVYRLEPIWVQRTTAILLSIVSFKLLGRFSL